MVGEGWELIKIRGIPLRIHPSWFAIVAITTVLFQERVTTDTAPALVESLAQAPAWIPWLVALSTSLLLFVSVLLHELGHALVALREGVKVRSITLFLMGGVARVDQDCNTAMGSLRVAAAGPLVSLLLALSLWAAFPFGQGFSPVLGFVLVQLGVLNLMLALFNLLPGLPLDGGLILKAVIWRLTGSREKGVQVATASGRALAMTALFYGVVVLVFNRNASGLWLMMLGWFGLNANRGQSQMMVLEKVLDDLKVSEAAGRRFRVLESHQTLRRLSQLRLQSEDDHRGADWVLITRSGRWIGWVDDRALRDLPVQNWDSQRLEDHLLPLEDLASIKDSEPLWKAVQALEKAPKGRLLVFSPAGLPSGTIDRMDLSEAVLGRLGVRLPPPMLEAARKQNAYPLGLVMLPQLVDSMQAKRQKEQSQPTP